LKLILDTNTVLSALFKPHSNASALIALWHAKAFDWVTCQHQLIETTRVLLRPKILTRVAGGEMAAHVFMGQMIEGCTFFPLMQPYLPLCRDAKDDYLVALLNQSKANHLITGDKDLLVLKPQWPQILTATDFLAKQ